MPLQGCPALVGVGGVAAVSSLEDRRTTGTQIEDQSIEARAMNQIAERIGERAYVTATAFNRSVLLTGKAWDEATRAEIERIVTELASVRGVTNEIEIGPISSPVTRTSDSALTAMVKGRLLGVKEVNSSHVKVVTEDGVVYLLGLVTEAEAEAAVQAVRTTGGVRKVVKIFEYCKSTDYICRPSAPPAPKSGA